MAGFPASLAQAGPLLLCLWLSKCGAVWRYATNTGDYLIFSTRTTIYLEFEGTTFREWNIPPLCTVGDKTMQRTTLHCSVPGTHQIGPVVTVPSPDDEERFLSIIADVNCFMWYIHQDVHRLSKKFSVQHLHAWIFDPENAEGSEINHTATSPPIYSKTLSKQFWNWGESPTISTFFGQKMYTAPLYNDGIWTHRVPTLSNDNIAMIFGKAVTFQDCFILDTPFVIAQPVQHLSNPAYIPVTSPPGSLAQVTWAACFPLTAVLVTDFGIFFTSDGFLNTEIIKIPAKILNTTLYNSVNDVAIAFPNVFILIGDMLYKASEYEIIKIGSGHNVPDSKIIGVQAKTWCSAEYPSITITFYHEEDYSKVFDYESSVILAQGVVTVEIQPSSAGKTCDKKVKLTHLRVGCSPEKRIEVAGKPTECENITFTIPWSSLINPTKEEDVEINYDIKTYGCPLEVDYEETFRPTVLLYMGERAIGTVEANYVLWEMNGRNDFNYNSTMEQVRCLNTAQTWQKAIEKINRTSSLTPDEVESLWGPRTLAVAAAAAAAGEATAHAGMQSRAMSYNGDQIEIELEFGGSRPKGESPQTHQKVKGSDTLVNPGSGTGAKGDWDLIERLDDSIKFIMEFKFLRQRREDGKSSAAAESHG
nr:PREDICTED: uncharacterized protein C1orf101 homolog [Anolis carolinensis]|eukprot:XP_016851622.1 PREDICTED: uncharacterized protein C1orf101 homolog [Anolis carolinensis]